MVAGRSPGSFVGTPREAIWLSAALLCAVALRFTHLDRPLWIDEFASLDFADRPLGQLWSNWMIGETNPPFYYTLLKGWIALFGDGEVAVHSLSALFGVLCVALIYWLVELASGPRAGCIAAIMLTFSGPAYFHSQNARAYGLALAFSLASVAATIRILQAAEEGRVARRWYLFYAISMVGALYCHTTMVVLPFLLNLFVFVYVVFVQKVRAILPSWIAANVAAGIAWAWWGYITLLQGAHPSNIQWIPPRTLLDTFYLTFQAYAFTDVPISLLTLVSALAFLVAVHRIGLSPALLLPWLAVAVPATMFVLSQVSPILVPRILFWGGGFYIGTLAIAITVVRPRILMSVPVAIWVFFGIVNIWEIDRQRGSYRDVVSFVEQWSPDAIVFTDIPTLFVRYCHKPCHLEVYETSPSMSFGEDVTTATPAVLAEKARKERTDLILIKRQRGVPVTVPNGRTSRLASFQTRLNMETETVTVAKLN